MDTNLDGYKVYAQSRDDTVRTRQEMYQTGVDEMIFDKNEPEQADVQEVPLRPRRPPLTQGIYLGFFTPNALLMTNTFDNRGNESDSPPIVSRSLFGLFDRC